MHPTSIIQNYRLLVESVTHGTRNTELAAALATLGFNPGGTGTRIAHEVRGRVWLFPERSTDGRYSLQERMARWADDA